LSANSPRHRHYTYTALFCEENIWLLAKSLQKEGVRLEDLQILFLSNPSKQIVLFEQNSAPLGQAVVWDYHVILWFNDSNKPLLYDFDSRLPFPCPARQYFHSSFPTVQTLPEKFHFYIRQIPANDYLEQFYSTREHMLGLIPTEHFPEYAAIKNHPAKVAISLAEYWDMEKHLNDHSDVYPYQEIFSRI